jgi:hypothetical protein
VDDVAELVGDLFRSGCDSTHYGRPLFAVDANDIQPPYILVCYWKINHWRIDVVDLFIRTEAAQVGETIGFTAGLFSALSSLAALTAILLALDSAVPPPGIRPASANARAAAP